jgi:hypothetical protein
MLAYFKPINMAMEGRYQVRNPNFQHLWLIGKLPAAICHNACASYTSLPEASVVAS